MSLHQGFIKISKTLVKFYITVKTKVSLVKKKKSIWGKTVVFIYSLKLVFSILVTLYFSDAFWFGAAFTKDICTERKCTPGVQPAPPGLLRLLQQSKTSWAPQSHPTQETWVCVCVHAHGYAHCPVCPPHVSTHPLLQGPWEAGTVFTSTDKDSEGQKVTGWRPFSRPLAEPGWRPRKSAVLSKHESLQTQHSRGKVTKSKE